MKLGVSIFSTVAVARGAVVLSVFEVNGIGIKMDNIDYEFENYTF